MREFYPPAHHFTPEIVKEILQGILKGNYKLPPVEKLRSLTGNLNGISGVFAFSKKYARESEDRADAVGHALETLSYFFEERKEAFDHFAANSEVVQREKRLYDGFHGFMHAMREHQFDLDMDTARFMTPLDTWRQIAELIANHFIHIMEPQEVGHSNGGPLPRFVAAVIPIITGEKPSVQNVAKHLKDCAAGKRRKPRISRREKGTLQ